MKRSKFSLSNYKLLSCNQGSLVPIGLTEVLPGDTIQHATSALIRVSPLVAPVMHPVHVRIHHWFVPNRLIWEDWEDFITGGPDGMDASAFPTIDINPTIGDLGDYLGIPTGLSTSIEVSALPFRAYQLVFNEWYRDQDLVTESDISIASGPDSTTSTLLRNCAWEKDYFTTARPWTQKGPEVTVPLGDRAPVAHDVANGGNISSYSTVNSSYKHMATGGTYLAASSASTGTEADSLYADLSNATAANINDLRRAFAIQRYEEARARYGSRYTEYLRYLGVRSSDARLQRPEYLGGGKQTIQFSEVLATAEGTNTEVGEMKGHGIGALRSNRYRRFFEEHGFVISLMSVQPKTIYADGIPRMWHRRTKEDFFQKELQFIGQQEIYNKELYANSAQPDAVFGYQDRYDEYRRSESSIAGEFRSTLNYWHMARQFATQPALNFDFVESNPTNRIYASSATDQLYVMAHHSIQARRLLSKNASSRII